MVAGLGTIGAADKVARDAEKKREHLPLGLVELATLFHQRDEGVLGDVVGERRRSAHVQGKAVHIGLQPFVERSKGFLVAGYGKTEELGLRKSVGQRHRAHGIADNLKSYQYYRQARG